jgi:hypothetical protein
MICGMLPQLFSDYGYINNTELSALRALFFQCHDTANLAQHKGFGAWSLFKDGVEVGCGEIADVLKISEVEFTFDVGLDV